MLRMCCAALVALGLATGPAAAFVPDPVCAAPEDAAGAIASLPAVAAVLKPGATLRVLALGSATIFGPEASLQPGTLTSQSLAPTPPAQPTTSAAPKPPTAAPAAFPLQMAKALEAEIPGLHVDVQFRGGKGMTAGDMLDQLRQGLATLHPQLVLWQTGTVEAVRNTPTGEFAQTLATGTEAIEAAHANLILIDPQFSRFLQTNANLDPYIQALQQSASLPGVMLFRRFDLMRSWAGEGRMDLERTPKAKRQSTVETLHACLGGLLAKMVLAGARS